MAGIKKNDSLHFLMRAIRFDDRNSRSERAKYDNIAPIRELFESFESSQLTGWRNRHYRRNVYSKPSKYGIKVYALCDSKNFCTSNLEI